MTFKKGKKPNKLNFSLVLVLIVLGTLVATGCVSENESPKTENVNLSSVEKIEEIKNETKKEANPDLAPLDEILPSEIDLRENLTYMLEKVGPDYLEKSMIFFLATKVPITKTWVDENTEIYKNILIIEEKRGPFSRLEQVKMYLDVLEYWGFKLDATDVIVIDRGCFFNELGLFTGYEPIRENESYGYTCGGGGTTHFSEDVICDENYLDTCRLEDKSVRNIRHYEEAHNPCKLIHEDEHNKGRSHEDEVLKKRQKECFQTLRASFNEKYPNGVEL